MIRTQSGLTFRRVHLLNPRLPRFFQPIGRAWLLYCPLEDYVPAADFTFAGKAVGEALNRVDTVN